MRFSPLQPLRQRLHRWWTSRLPATDHLLLTQHNVYIVPTGAGWMLLLTLLVLLIASINFQLNLGYLLTFLLAGSASVGMWMSHATLRGLHMRVLPPQSPFLGHTATLTVELINTRPHVRYGIALASAAPMADAVTRPLHWAYSDVPAQGSVSVHITFTPERRGRHALPWISAETRYPLGTFRVWSWWRPASEVLIYPAPEPNAPPLPAGQPHAGQARSSSSARGSGEFDGVRAYQRGDPLKLLVWKKAAQAFATGSGALVSRDTQHSQRVELWLDVNHCGLSDPEARVSRVTAWVLQADRMGLRWGLRLPGGVSIPVGEGAQQRRLCLEALALC